MALTPNITTLGGRIARLMIDKGYKINAMARLVDLSGQGFRDILSGQSANPKINVIVKLSELLQVSTDWLLLGRSSAEGFSGYELAEGPSEYLPIPGGSSPGVVVPLVTLRSLPRFVSSGGEVPPAPERQSLTVPALLQLPQDLVAFEIDDNSLAPEIPQGALVVASHEIEELRFLPSGNIYAVLFAGRLRVMKMSNSVEDASITLTGNSSKVPSIRVLYADVARLWRVRYTLNRI
jgi:transcriptional regulator with XRE-family HTH domain